VTESRWFTLVGYTVPKPRPRVLRNGHAYTPASAREAEHRLREAYRERYSLLAPMEGPLRLDVEVVRARPKGHFGARGLRPSAPIYPAARPDLDNYLKTVLDALNGVAWRDDGQVVEVAARKLYGDAEGWCVRIATVQLINEDTVGPVEARMKSRTEQAIERLNGQKRTMRSGISG
jgi:Holliday junction resolvase RusA-like endonuclease